MRTVTFQSVLNGITQLLGMVPSRDLNPNRAAALVEYINQRMVEAWRWDFWPEWTVAEQRYYRPLYDATQTVTAGSVGSGNIVTGGTEVYFPASGQYYQALQNQAPAAQAPAILTNNVWAENSAWWALSRQSYASGLVTGTLWQNGQTSWSPTMTPNPATMWTPNTAYVVGQQVTNPNDGNGYQCIAAHTSGASFDATKFGVLFPFNKYVGYEQTQGSTALTPIDEVKGVWRRNPRVFTNNPGPLGWSPSDAGVQVEWKAPNMVWVEFRLRPPVFTASIWSSTTAYAAGALVYAPATSGECYVALAATTGAEPSANPALWKRQVMPAVTASYVKRAAFADALKDQKQTDRAAEELQEAQQEIMDAWDRLQGVADQAAVVAYGR